MKIGRRGLLKLAGGLVAATVAAPIAAQTTSAGVYIPAERLEMGVPRALKPLVPIYPPLVSRDVEVMMAMYERSLMSRDEFERTLLLDGDPSKHVYLAKEPGLGSFREDSDFDAHPFLWPYVPRAMQDRLTEAFTSGLTRPNIARPPRLT